MTLSIRRSPSAAAAPQAFQSLGESRARCEPLPAGGHCLELFLQLGTGLASAGGARFRLVPSNKPGELRPLSLFRDSVAALSDRRSPKIEAVNPTNTAR